MIEILLTRPLNFNSNKRILSPASVIRQHFEKFAEVLKLILTIFHLQHLHAEGANNCVFGSIR